MSINSHDNSTPGDINDVFDSIAFSEDNIASNGFKEGLKKGQSDGELEGYHLGYHRGAELGSEIGFYKGFLEAFNSIENEEMRSRHKNTIEKLSSLIESFPKANDDTFDIVSVRDSIRSTYKKLCSVLKIEPEIPDNSNLSF